MFFNPLFLQVINNPESVNSAKSQKLNGASYLFSDIIKVAFEKTESEGISGSTVSETAAAGFGTVGGFDAAAFLNEIGAGSKQTENALYQLLGEVVPGSFKLGDLSGSNGIVGLPLVNNNDSKSIVLSENEVASMISKFLDGNFHGRVNVLSGKNDQKKINVRSFDIQDDNTLSSGDLFDLLKEGNAVSLESSDAQNAKGLLITLFKISSGEAAEQLGALTENTQDSLTAGTDNETGNEAAEALPDSSAVSSDKLYRMEITLIDKTGYQELSSLAMAKSGAPSAGEILNAGSAVGDVSAPDAMPLNQTSKIFRIENGLTGPSDMSDFAGVSEELSEAAPQAGKSAVNAAAEETKTAGVKQTDVLPNKDASGTVNGNLKNTSADKTMPAQGNLTNPKIENNQTVSEPAAAPVSPNNSSKQPVKENTASSAPKTAQELTAGKTVSKKGEGSTNAPSAQNIDRPADTTDAAPQNQGRPAEVTGAAAQDAAGASSRLNKSGVLKNVNLTLKSSRTPREMNPEKETAGSIAAKPKQTDTNPEIISGQIPETAAEIPAKDLKELNKNISDRIFAKQMHDAGSPVNEKDAKTANASAENNENQKVLNQETAAAQSGSDNTEKELAANSNEQHAQHKKDEPNAGNNDLRFSSEINKASDNIVREKPAGEGTQNNLPHKLVKAADVLKEISGFIERNEGHSLTIKIDPESLGTVKIALDVVDKLVHANIEVENEAAKKMMENNLSQLQHSLAQSGIQLNSLNISLANQDSRQGKTTGNRKKTFNNELESDFEQENVKETRQMGYNTYEYTI